MNCILCNSKDLNLIEIVNHNCLVSLWKKVIGIEVSDILVDDIKFYECSYCGLSFFYPVFTGDENFYNKLQRFDWYYMKEKNEYKFASKYITAKDSVLEVGCGYGYFRKFISPCNYIGLELSIKAIEYAEKNGIYIENCTIEEYVAKTNNKFDVIVSFQVLEHLKNPKDFIELQILLLNTGGRLIISVPNDETYLRYLVNEPLNMPPHHITRWKERTFRFIAEKYNLKIIDINKEKLQHNHKIFYLSSLIYNSFMKYKLIDLSLKRKILNNISFLISKILLKGLKDEMLPCGHTITVVYSKY